MGDIEITTKFSRLKRASSIDDNYLEVATGGVLHRKTPVLESLFNKVAGLRENTGVFLFVFGNF